jgi:hypothetical protein
MKTDFNNLVPNTIEMTSPFGQETIRRILNMYLKSPASSGTFVIMKKTTIVLLFFILLPFKLIADEEIDAQKFYFVSGEGIRVRSAPDEFGEILGHLSLNDQVRLIESAVIYNGDYVEIEIIKTNNTIDESARYFSAKAYLSEKYVDYREFTGKYFIVVNVASETLRLYERSCIFEDCKNIMLMETEVAVGEDKNNPKTDTGKARSLLGSFRLTGWTKFYEDGAGHYPAWYNENYPEVPKAKAHDPKAWFNPRYMPANSRGKKRGKMRGAFGWYTAFMTPNHYSQWLHGTIGWGEDKDYYIKSVKKLLTNIFLDPRSSGCTRNNNEAIAYLRQLINIGAPIIKIYAEEKIFDPILANYPIETSHWNYVLTKNKVKKSDREEVLNYLGITAEELDAYWAIKKAGDSITLDPSNPLNQVLEVGTYQIDSHPDSIIFTPGERMSRMERKLGRKGNVYGVQSKDMRGVYYIDTGILKNYEHPKSILQVSGFPDEVIPPWMMMH